MWRVYTEVKSSTMWPQVSTAMTEDERGEKTQHPPTHSHTPHLIFLRHYSSSIKTSTKQASPLCRPYCLYRSPPLLSCLSLSLFSLCESEGSLHHLLQDAANHLRVRACARKKKTTEGGEIPASVVSSSPRSEILMN